MTQKGLKINASSIIDSLVYGYAANSNQLLYVTDKVNDTTARMGDFTEINNNTTQDYWYDGNGNYTKDNNKGISAVTYNFMNLPQQITVTGKGTVNYTYDAAGNKLQKKITQGARVVTYQYSGAFLYKNDTLQYALTSEGRIRYNMSGLPVYDYFVKDHLGNVRMVLTDEKDTSKYPMATLENSHINTERLLYSGLDSGRVNKSTVPGYPADGTTSPNDYIQQLSGNGYKIGSGIILKVMTGDQVAIKVSSWYKKNGATPNSPNDLAASLVAGLISSLTGAGGPVHGSITSSQLTSSGVIPLSTTSFLNNRTAPGSTKPKAYINWVLLDDQFKFVSSGSGAEQVGNDQEFKVHTPTSNISKNGYLYVFVSNETPNINVFFDNLQVTHLKGPLLEESHYYPFGTEMSAISSHSLPSYVPNRYKANAGAEYGDEEWSNPDSYRDGLEMYETFYRSYNAQIGRFMQDDPMMEATISMSGYVFSGNNPVLFTDLLGDQMKYMDSRGNVWHHRDPLEGTPMAGIPYTEGWGSDGFGDMFNNGLGGGDRGKGRNGSQVDYTSQWEDIKAGLKSGKGDAWKPGYGFYDKSLYPDDAKWVKLEEVVVSGRKNNFSTPYENINEFFQDPYIIQNGKNIPLSTFDKGTQRFSHGYSSATTLILNDGQLRNYLNQNRKYFDKVNNPLYAIAIGLAFVRANPWISGAAGTWSGLQSISMSEMSAKFNQVLIDYLSQNEKNGMYLIVRDVSYTPGWGAAVSSHSTGIQFYFPQGVLFREISYSFH